MLISVAVCDPECQNGGECVLNDTCSCPSEFTGPICAGYFKEQDILNDNLPLHTAMHIQVHLLHNITHVLCLLCMNNYANGLYTWILLDMILLLNLCICDCKLLLPW